MKKVQTGLVVAIIASVFFISFLIGRATALKENKNDSEQTQIYTETVPVPKENEESVETTGEAEKVPDNTMKVTKEEEPDADVPEKMLFPCGESVLKGYSQTAVYSETMGDWRAHTGIDYAAEKGDGVVSAWDGTVVKVYKDKLWGHCVEISHAGNVKSVYKNLESKIQVKKGEKVKAGQAIGKVGDSAAIESREIPHLHFEIWQDSTVINPESYVY